MDNVMGSAAEAKIGAAYINGREDILIRTTLQEMNHPQPPTKIQVDNTTVIGFATDTIQKNAPRPLICVSIRSVTDADKANSKYIGNPDTTTLVIIIQNTNHPPIIVPCAQPFSIHGNNW